MAQSTEWPDLKWVEANAYGTGRDGYAVRYVVIHYTAGSERATSAEDGAASDATRTDGVSTHYFHDSNSTVQCVHTKNRANAARHKGNRLGVQHELCGTVQTRAQWLDAASLPTLRNAAKQVARDCKKYNIPVRRLSVDETRRAWTEFPNGPRGIVGHVDCTYAYPEDGGDHTDPGTEFPWNVFLDMVRDELEETVPLTDPEYARIANDTVNRLVQRLDNQDDLAAPSDQLVVQLRKLNDRALTGVKTDLAAVKARVEEPVSIDVPAVIAALVPAIETTVAELVKTAVADALAETTITVDINA